MTSGYELRGGLGRLSSGLIAYGILGLVVAAIGFGALVWVNDRVSSLRGEVETTLRQRATTMELAAKVLHDASTTAQSFTVTVDQSSQAVSSAADTITEARSDLTAMEAQLRSVSILGATPLSSAADAVGRIATSMEGLDTRLSLIADSLQGNRNALAANATSLGQLGDITEALAARLGLGVIEDSLGDLQRVISVTLLVFTAWSAAPAVGALLLGLWLRRAVSQTAIASDLPSDQRRSDAEPGGDERQSDDGEAGADDRDAGADRPATGMPGSDRDRE